MQFFLYSQEGGLRPPSSSPLRGARVLAPDCRGPSAPSSQSLWSNRVRKKGQFHPRTMLAKVAKGLLRLQSGMCDTDFFDIEKTSIFGRGFCNINNNINRSSKHFAISISISILPQCISRYQYQFQYSLKGFCNTNINFNIMIKHFAISIPISISA